MDNSVGKIKIKTVDSGVLEHLMEQVSELQGDLEVVLRELLPSKHEAIALDDAINLDQFLRKLKLALKHPIGKVRN